MTGTLRVFLRGLRLDAEVGLHAHERGRTQPLIVDMTVELDAALVKGIGDTLDYDRLAGAARRLAAEGHCELVETFAQRLAAVCMDHAPVRSAVVRVEKPEAVPDALAAGVEVTMRRP